MADFKEAYKILVEAEYSGKEYLFLHKNKRESTITTGGIYEKANPSALDYDFIKSVLKLCGYDINAVNKLEDEQYDVNAKLLNPNLDQFHKGVLNDRLNEIDFRLKEYKKNIQRASRMIYADDKTRQRVFQYFKVNYWDIMRLSEVHSQKVANEIFLFGVVAGVKTSAKMAQSLVGAKPDGFIGDISLKCLNNYNSDMFDKQFDNLERNHFDLIIEKNPHLAMNKEGWYNRSNLC